MAKKFDSFQLNKFEKTPQGYLKVDGIVTRTGVFKYDNGNELRPVEEVLKYDSLVTLEALPVTWEHPPDMLDPQTTSSYQKGFVSSKPEILEENGNYLIKLSNIIISDPTLIYEMEKQDSEYQEFSLGYDSIDIIKKGKFDSQEYDKIQTNIRYNHLAVVRAARCGPICSIVKGETMLEKKNDSICTCKNVKNDSEEKEVKEKKKEDKKMDSEERFASLEKGHEKIIGMMEELKEMMKVKSDKKDNYEEESKEEKKKDKKKDSILSTIYSYQTASKSIPSHKVYDRDDMIKSAVVRNFL